LDDIDLWIYIDRHFPVKLMWNHISEYFVGKFYDHLTNKFISEQMEMKMTNDMIYGNAIRACKSNPGIWLTFSDGRQDSTITNEKIIWNPHNRFRQGYLNTSAFHSLANALENIGYNGPATELHRYAQKWYYETDLYDGILTDIQSYILQIVIDTEPVFYDFNKEYSRKLIPQGTNILSKDYQDPLDIYWVSFNSEQNDCYTHVVAIVGGYIYDPRLRHALRLTRQSLNEVCKSKYKHVHKGYHFIQIQSEQT
jgi:hypothetical protein